MKKFKTVMAIFIVTIIVLPIALYFGIVITNNSIADKVEKSLVKYQLPPQTEIVDSVSFAGKLTGNGNGMQYMGAILIKSDLTEKQLTEYYKNNFDYIEINKQQSNTIIFDHSDLSFQAELEEDKTYYSVVYWGSNNELSPLFQILLDFDIRGH